MLDFASVCAGGKDKENHDYVGVLEESHCTCFAIADGKNTPDASEIVVNSVMSDFKQQSDITTLTLPAFFEKSQDALISAENDTELPRSCAAAVLLTDGEVAVWAHIGDCRIYHLQDNLLYEITPDHSEAYSRYEAGEIRYPMIRRDRTRRNLYRLMGAKHDFKPEFSAPAVIRKNDCFLICTDGFWENIHERQIEKTLKRSKSAEDWLKRMVKVVEKNRGFGKYTKISDDYSAVTIKI